MSRSKSGARGHGSVIAYVLMCLVFVAFTIGVGWVLARGTSSGVLAFGWTVLVTLFVPAILYPLFFLQGDRAAEFRRTLYKLCIVVAVVVGSVSIAFVVFLVLSD